MCLSDGAFCAITAFLAGLVLGFELPPMIQKVISALKPLAMSIKGIIQLDCLGAIDFYQQWIVRDLVIPSVLVVIVSLRYSYEVRRGEEADAAGNLKANICFIIFVLYPGARCFSPSPSRSATPLLSCLTCMICLCDLPSHRYLQRSLQYVQLSAVGRVAQRA